MEKINNQNYKNQLIITVGASSEPIIKSIKETKPKKIIFISSEESKQAFLKLDQELEIEQHNTKWIVLKDYENIEIISRQIKEEAKIEHISWIKNGMNYLSVLDFTGGTKAMSVGLVLSAYNWEQCRFLYIGGERNKQARGIVKTGTERSVKSHNPLQLYGYQKIEEAILLFDSYNYLGAYNKMESLYKSSKKENHPTIKNECFAIKSYFEMFYLWDNFSHLTSQNTISLLTNKLNDLKKGFESFSDLDFENNIKNCKIYLDKITKNNKGPIKNSVYLIADLIVNAYRKSKQGKYDDAIARLYRSIEAIAQHQLEKEYQIDTKKVSLDQLTPKLKNKYSNQKVVKLALQDSFLLLKEKHNPLGQIFFDNELKLLDKHNFPKDLSKNTKNKKSEISYLSKRNQSILAHGFQSMGVKDFENLFESTLSLFNTLQEIEKNFVFKFKQDNKNFKKEFEQIKRTKEAPFFPILKKG